MPRPVEDALAGAFGAVTAVLCTCPLDVAKTRLQAQRRHEEDGQECHGPASRRSSRPYRGTADCLRRVVVEEGAAQLFAGLLPACGKAAAANFVYYYVLRLASRLRRLSPLLRGMLAGVAVQLAILPLDMVVTRLQAGRGAPVPGSGGSGWGAMAATVQAILAESGLAGLWRGLGPGLLLTLNPGIVEVVQAQLVALWGRSSVLRNIATGAVSKAVASAATYPYVRAKVLLQVQPAGQRRSAAEELASVAGSGGLVALYDGLAPQLLNAVLKEAVLNAVRLEVVAAAARLVGRRPAALAR